MIELMRHYNTEFHYDGIHRTYLKYKYTQADKNRITGEGSEVAFQGTALAQHLKKIETI